MHKLSDDICMLAKSHISIHTLVCIFYVTVLIMLRQYFHWLSLLFFTFIILLSSGCKGISKPKSQAAAIPEHAAIKKTPLVKSVPQSVPFRKIAIGNQQGGARQGEILSLKNIVSTFAGRAGDTGADDGNAMQASFNAPKGIATDGTSLYLADLNNHTIRKIDIESGAVTTLAGAAGKKGSRDGKGESARFNRPYGLTTDGKNLYVTDSNNHTVRQINLESGVVTTLAGRVGEVGYRDGSGRKARFFIPEGITTDGSNLYVSDTHNHSVRKISLRNKVVSTLAGLSGSPGYLDEMGKKARFSYPKGITTDGRNLYVVDFGNHQIRKIVIATGLVSTLSGAGNSDGSTAEQAETMHFNYPTGITTDGHNLYVADTFNRTVRKIVLKSGVVTTIAGQADQEGTVDGAGAEARFKELIGVTTDGSDLYVTDTESHTVRKIQ